MNKIVSFFGDQSDVFVHLNEKAAEYADSRGMEYKWSPQLQFNRENVIKELKNADAGIIDIQPFGESIFSQIKDSSKLLVRFGVGFDQVDLAAASRHGIAIARTTGANTTAVAEMALMLMLTAVRKFPVYEECIKKGIWSKEVGHELIGNTVGIVGFGVIGQRLAKLLKGFDCNILVCDPFPQKEALDELGARVTTLEELFRESDAVSIHTPYCKETHHMINESLLLKMKSNAVLVNTARGNLVDENALYNVLKERKIAAAGFDVFAVEPLPMDSPLRTLDNMILTPHVSSQTKESLWNIYKTAIDIAADFFEGKDSRHILNPEYRQLSSNKKGECI